MARWSKSKAKLETVLPPLTTEQVRPSTTPNWHQIKMDEGPDPIPLWTVTWDTSKQPGAFNTAHHASRTDAFDCTKRFLRMGFVVYSIKDPAGIELMNEEAINAQFAPEPQAARAPRLPPSELLSAFKVRQ